MDEIMSTSAEPAYLTRLGLAGLPFGKLKQHDDFYAGGQYGQNKKLIQHLLRSTGQNIILQAETGLGKTTLLQTLEAEAATDLRFCQLNATRSPQQILAEIGQSLVRHNEAFLGGIPDHEALEKSLRNLRQRHIKVVLLVDDAEQFAPRALEIIAGLAGKQHEGRALLQVVLCCVQSTVEMQRLFPYAHTVTLMPLGGSEIEPYLMHRLWAAGYQGKCPFSQRERQTLYKKSKGNLAALDLLAHQMLLREQQKTKTFSLPGMSRSLIQLVGGSIALILVLFILIFQDDINQWVNGQQQEEIESPPLQTQLNDDIVTVETTQHKAISRPQNPQDELAELLAELDSTVKQSDNPLSPTTAAEPIKSGQRQHKVFDHNWILSQRGEHYTFQLKGTWTRQGIDDYIEQYDLRGEVAIFTSLRDDKPWHVLLYGVYDNKQAALQASKSWPPPLNGVSTWLRSFDSVQKQIKEKGVTP